MSWKATPFWCSLVGLRGGRGACEMNLQSIFIMGSHKQKKSSQTNVKKRKQSAGESYESSDSGSETQQPTSQTLLNVPRFLVVKSQEEKRTMADLSPFVIEKCIQSIVGHPKTIKKLKSGDLLLEVDRQQQVENLLKTTKIFDLKVKISLHQSLNSSKGVIRCPELHPCSDKEIIDNLTDQGVTGVRNVKVRKNGVLKSTNTYVLTFNTPILPKKIKVAFLSVNVEVYIPNPLRCYQCQVFGHHEDYCMKKPICGNCGGERHCSDDRNCKNTAKCVNCNGNHPVFSRDCPTWKKEKAILKVKYEKSITFPEARKLVEEQFAAPGKTYASITKVAGVHVSCTDAQTQTDETCIAELKSATSNAGSKPTLAPPLSGMAQIKMGVVPSTSTQPNPAETKSTPKPAETKSAPNAKDKVDTGRTAKGSDDPIKTHNRYGAFNEDDMETEVTPSSPRRSIITRIPTT